MFGFFKKESKFVAPIDGKVMNLSDVPDPVFAEKMAGDGVAIDTTGDTIVAPCDGELTLVFKTNHAFAMTLSNGVELLVHIGIDTVSLNGEGFEALVETGQMVKKGDPMLKLDLEYLNANAPSMVSPILCTELEENQSIRLIADGAVKAGDPLFEIEIK